MSGFNCVLCACLKLIEALPGPFNSIFRERLRVPEYDGFESKVF